MTAPAASGPGASGQVPASVGWDRAPDVAAWTGYAPLAGDVTADACVVGLGASGLAAVDELCRRGLSVVGVDAGRVAAGAAGRNGGFLIAGPAPGLRAAVSGWGRADAEALYHATAEELERTADRLGPDVVHRCGSIRLAGLPGPDRTAAEAADRAAELADCEAEADALRAIGVPVSRYDGPLGRGLTLPRDAAVNPARRALVAARWVAGTHAGRVRLFEHTRVRAVAPGAVACDPGVVTAPHVVVAVDGRLDALVPGVPVRTARLQMLATAPVAPGRLPGPVYARWGYDYAQQGADGRLFVGGGRDRFADQEWTSSGEPSGPVQAVIDDVAARMAGGPVTVTDRWAASVGYTDDGRPVCGVTGSGVAVCGGYSGTGNLVGPVAARAAVAALLDGTAVPGWATPPG